MKDYTEKVFDDFVLYEPSSLPFGGKYVGLKEYETVVVPKITAYYDFRRFEFKGIYADSDVVVVILKIGIQQSDKSLFLCERFTFRRDKIAEIRVFNSN